MEVQLSKFENLSQSILVRMTVRGVSKQIRDRLAGKNLDGKNNRKSLKWNLYTVHRGANSDHFETPIIHFPRSEEVSEVRERANEWAQRSARAKRGVQSKQTSERCERTSERTSEWPSTYVPILGCSAALWHAQQVQQLLLLSSIIFPISRGLALRWRSICN